MLREPARSARRSSGQCSTATATLQQSPSWEAPGKPPTAPCAPCGVCRQVMMEFCQPNAFRIILAGNPGQPKSYTLDELLPLGFGPENLSGNLPDC